MIRTWRKRLLRCRSPRDSSGRKPRRPARLLPGPGAPLHDRLSVHGIRGAGRDLSGEARLPPGWSDEVEIVDAGCHGQCVLAPAVVIEPHNFLYGGVRPEDVDEIIETSLRQGEPVERLCQNVAGEPAPTLETAPFYSGQERLVLANCGKIDPKRIEDAIATGGYAAVAKALETMEPEAVVDEVREAGLRGRGGAGFPTGSEVGAGTEIPRETRST